MASLSAFEARLLERRVVIIVEIVDADNLLAAVEQRMGGRRSDKAGGAGDENGHGSLLAERCKRSEGLCSDATAA